MSWTTSYYHYDGLHNAVQLTDATQTVTDTATYNAFGEKVESTGSTTNPFGYKGELGYYANPDTDDLYVRARSYKPTIARWLSVDPIWVLGASNKYRYAEGIPTRLVDPSGELTSRILSYSARRGCGQLDVLFRYELSATYAFEGYLVQKVVLRDNVKACGNKSCDDAGVRAEKWKRTRPIKVFWEAWPVASGKKSWKDGGTDAPSHPWGPQKYGKYEACGIIKFFPKAEQGHTPGTGDLGDVGRVSSDPENRRTWGPGKVPESARLPSTLDKPQWWKEKPIEGYIARFTIACWCCCGTADNWDESFADALGSDPNIAAMRSEENTCPE